MAVADTLLVTPAELSAWQRNRVSALDTEAYAVPILAAAQAGLARYLGYEPLVHKVTRFRPGWAIPGGWPSEYDPWSARVPGPPVVQVDAGEYEATAGYYTVTLGANGRTLEVDASDPLPPIVDVWRGWRGSQHTLDGAGATVDLTALPGLDGLTALPPLVSEHAPEVYAAICNAAIYTALYIDGLGVHSESIDLGAQVRQIESVYSLNDVNVLIGRVPEVTAIYQTCHRWRVVSV